MITHVFVMKKL